MTLTEWMNFLLSAIVTAVNWLKSITVFDVPMLYVLLSITVMGIVLSRILFSARG